MMKIKKNELYNVMDLIGILEKIKSKEIVSSKEHFSNLVWERFMANTFDGGTVKSPTLHVELPLSDKHYLDVKLKIIEYGDETFYIKDITCEIEKY